MNTISFIGHSVQPVKYNDLYFRLLAAVYSAYRIVSFGQKETLWEFLVLPEFYFPFFASLLIALVIVQLVYGVSCRLDRLYPWGRNILVRILLQLFFGVACLLLVAYLLGVLYFYIQGIPISRTVYTSHYLPMIQDMLLAFNFYYAALYHYIRAQQLILREQDAMAAEQSKVETEDIGMIFSIDRNYFVRTMDGNTTGWADSLKLSMTELPAAQFFMLHRSCIINRAAIMSVKRSRRKLILELQAPFGEKLTVSKRNIPAFRLWWGEEIL